MHFTRTLSVKHHPTGDHYQLSIPAQVAQALDLQDGGLVSIEIVNKLNTHKKGHVRLQAYRDSQIPWRQAFNPSMWRDPAADLFRPVPVPPNTLGRSRPTGRGEVIDFKAAHRDCREGLRFLEVLKRKVFPHGYKRGPKRRWH
jgi:hypothetical protein